MLFSRKDVADFINTYFEPVWESVRPVPTVRIDFGNGIVLTRTLHGNIATYVCSPDGQVLDILPGIYAPEAYLDGLNQFRLLANYVDQQGKTNRLTRLRDYHRRQIAALQKNGPAAFFINGADLSKSVIEGGVKALLVSGVRQSPRAQPKAPALASGEDRANWNLLAQDTRRNETVRRLQIHKMLAAAGSVRPRAVTKPLYKEVLHADLDDPYLGLKPVLFDSYAFAKEDSAKAGH